MSVKVSVIVAAYNAEKTLARCIESLLRQSLSDFEILVVNDGSTDGTESLLDMFSSKDERVRVFSQPNSGPAAARSLALSHMEGEYLAFVDSDDEVDEKYLEKLCTAIESANADLAVCAHCRIKGEDVVEYPMDEGILSVREIRLESFLLGAAIRLGNSIWGKLYRTRIIRENTIDFFTSRYSEDHIFNLCYYCFCDRVVKIPDRLYMYYIYDSSLMANIPSNLTSQTEHTMELYAQFVDDKGKRADVGIFYHAVWLMKAFELINAASRCGLRGIKTCLNEVDALPSFTEHIRELKGKPLGRATEIKRLLISLRPKWFRSIMLWLCMKYLLRNSLR